MNGLDIPEDVRKLARALLKDINYWRIIYRNKLKTKYPNITEEEIREKTIRAEAKKFRKEFNQIMIYRITERVLI